MSVIVKGMEMPVNCFRCPLDSGVWKPEQGPFILCRYTKGKVDYDDVPTDRRLPCCGLKEMPEKHGRLIDGDALHALYESRWHDLQVLNWDENPHAEDIQTGVNWCINTLHDDLPTIVEAEG